MLKTDVARIRCEPVEKEAWMQRAGGARQFSEWARGLLNLAVRVPQHSVQPAMGRPEAVRAHTGFIRPAVADAAPVMEQVRDSYVEPTDEELERLSKLKKKKP